MRERAYRQLRRLLILQQVPAGKRLREAEWTEKLKVNRSALREAFARLEAQGLIEEGPKTGYFVPVLDSSNIREVLAVRNMLETGAVEIICATGLNTGKHLEEMSKAIDRLEKLISNSDIVEIAEADWGFHHALVQASGNKRLTSVYHHAPLPLIMPDETSGPKWEDAMRQTVREHRAILAAMLDGKPDEAVRLLRNHISDRSLVLAESHKHEPPPLPDASEE